MHPNTLSTIYADESDDKQRFVMAFVRVPTASIKLPATEWDAEALNNDWTGYFEKARAWRKMLKDKHKIPIAKELKGSKLATGRNRYDRGKGALYGVKAWNAYWDALQGLSFLTDRSIFRSMQLGVAHSTDAENWMRLYMRRFKGSKGKTRQTGIGASSFSMKGMVSIGHCSGRLASICQPDLAKERGRQGHPQKTFQWAARLKTQISKTPEHRTSFK